MPFPSAAPVRDNAVMSTTTQPPKPKRRWYQFSLKTGDAMKRMTRGMLPIVLLLFVGTSMYSAERENGQKASKVAAPQPDSQIAKWISQLDDDEFKIREQAQQALTKAGLKALPAVLKATESKRVEVRNRAFEILFALSKSDDKPTANAVRTALEEILESQDRRRVAQAKRILEYTTVRAKQAMAVIKKLRGRVALGRHKAVLGVILKGRAVNDATLEHLKELTKLQFLYLSGTQVTDAGLEHLKGLSNLKLLLLGNTKVTDAGLVHLKGLTKLQYLDVFLTHVTADGVKKLQQALPNCKIRRHF